MPQENSDSFFTELLKFVVVAAVIVLPVRLFVAQPFIVSGESMDPTFKNGQYLIVDELTYRLEDPKRGDVVIFRYPRNPSEFFIKRIIGLPGETVTIQDGTVSVMGADGSAVALNEPYVKNIGNGRDSSYPLGADEYFVMGDNRPESSDSRIWGVLPRENMIGRALVRLLPVGDAGVFPGSATYSQ
ncbi:MAG: signal peptidase signal peptidase [Candidatus Adlerbacteria bacterium]|nr:signal peptidase signal peptidase [Candidatus Adlerbacteria bacterium]